MANIKTFARRMLSSSLFSPATRKGMAGGVASGENLYKTVAGGLGRITG